MHQADGRRIGRIAVALALALASALLAACPANDGQQDAAVEDADADASSEQPIAPPDLLGPDKPPLTVYKVGAIQYDGDYKSVPGCADDLCGITHFIKEAQGKGAQLVLTAEYALGQKSTEVTPAIGDRPATDSRWNEGGITKTLTKLASQLGITIVFNLITKDGTMKYNTSVAVDGSGKVVARHFKFDLFMSESVTAGSGIDAKDFFMTPAGKVGMLICADVECLANGITCVAPQCPDCAPTSPDILKAFAAEKPQVILFSASWTVGGVGAFGAIPIQKNIAKSFKAWVAAANTTSGQGRGGGIYDPTGVGKWVDSSGVPMVIYGELPLHKP